MPVYLFSQQFFQGALRLFTSLTAFSILSCSLAVMAQEDIVIQEISSRFAESLPVADDLSQLTEHLSYFRRRPIDLNRTSPEQLKGLMLLSALQISNFFSYLRTNGKLKSILELQAVNGFDTGTISSLTPFIRLNQEEFSERIRDFRSLKRDGGNELILRYGQLINEQKGYKDLPGSAYLGGPQKLLLKYKYNLTDQLAFSFTAEKDAGERVFRNQKFSAPDFLSVSIAFYKCGPFQKVILGDYSLQFGQGLTLWTGLSFGKGADVSWLAKNDTSLKPFTSADEFAFFRGISSTVILLKNIYLTPFISLRSLDATINESEEGRVSISTIDKAGLHRTVTETARKGSLKQLLYGSAIQWKTAGMEIGIIAYQSSYNKEFRRGNQRYKAYGLEGRSLSNFGFHYSYHIKDIYFFGETAGSSPGGIASSNGAMMGLSPSVSAAVLFRSFAKNHITFYSQALSAGGSASNENAFYTGLHYFRSSKWEMSVYMDLYRFPWAKYRIDNPSSGFDLLGTLSYTPRKTTKMLFRIKVETAEQNKSTGLPINPLFRIWKENFRIGANWKLNARVKMQNRMELSLYKSGNETRASGYMIYQDADFSWPSARISSNLRLAYFNIPAYDNRIYAYEDDVLYAAGSGLYNGIGWRSYLNINYTLSRKLKAWARYACSYYPGNEKIGTGLDEISGNSRSEFKLQLRYQF